jgi:hypothetical protein
VDAQTAVVNIMGLASYYEYQIKEGTYRGSMNFENPDYGSSYVYTGQV